MNNKRLMEKIAAIASIVLGGMMALIGATMLAFVGNTEMLDEVVAMLGETYGEVLTVEEVQLSLRIGMIFLLCVGAIECALGILYLQNVRKKGYRLGVGIPLTVVNFVVAIIFLLGGVGYLSFVCAAIAVVCIVSMCMKTPAPRVETRITYFGDPFSGSPQNPTPIDPFAPAGRSERKIDPFDYDGKSAGSAPNEDSLDKKVADLKKLRDDGVITEEQYREAIEKLIK